tara:strand:- start:503 stop:1276 length:774 start_codon:yes stop_codon:yes gene_type:complete
MNNFGKIKDTFNLILTESIIKKDSEGKKLFISYLKELKENKSLKSQFLLYKNLSDKKFINESDAKYYIKENIELLKKLDKKEINSGSKKLVSLLEGKELVKENIELYNHINVLVETKKTASSIDKIQESINYITKKMMEVDEEEVEQYESLNLPPSVLTKLAINRFNLKYSDITESEKKIIKSVLNGTDENKEDVYVNLKKECIDLIDSKLNENTDLDMKDKLLRVKDKLLSMTYNPDEYVGDIDKVYQLKQSVATD